jgi:hypothetical protein
LGAQDPGLLRTPGYPLQRLRRTPEAQPRTSGHLGTGIRAGGSEHSPLLGKDSGRRCPHRHWEWLWNGDGDVANPLHPGAVSGCAPSGHVQNPKVELQPTTTPIGTTWRRPTPPSSTRPSPLLRAYNPLRRARPGRVPDARSPPARDTRSSNRSRSTARRSRPRRAAAPIRPPSAVQPTGFRPPAA